MTRASKEGEEHSNGRTFHRDPGSPFNDYRVESFCKARAKGGTIYASATHAGIAKNTGLKWEQHPEVRARQRELREGAEDFVGVSVAWVISELKKNAHEAREANAYKASNEALVFIYKIIGERKDLAHQMAAALPAALEGQALQRALRESFNNPDVADEIVIEARATEEGDVGDPA